MTTATREQCKGARQLRDKTAKHRGFVQRFGLNLDSVAHAAMVFEGHLADPHRHGP
jgi:hypothetical protein